MEKHSASKNLWKDYWQQRQVSLQNPQGKRRAVMAAFNLAKQLARNCVRPIRIIELGCGEGHILGEMQRLCALEKIRVDEWIGIDNQATAIVKGRRLYPQIDFFAADYATEQFDMKPFDIVMLIGTLHEVYSSNYSTALGEIDHESGAKAVETALLHNSHLVGDNRYIVLFDGVEHSLARDLKITLRFHSGDSLNEFKKLASEYEAFHIRYEVLDSPDRVQTSIHSFTRYITKTRFFNSSLWQIEKKESYQYFSENEFKACLAELGFKPVKVQCCAPYLDEWRKRVTIETSDVNFPKENILIVGQNSKT